MDKLGDEGIVVFITNNSFIEGEYHDLGNGQTPDRRNQIFRKAVKRTFYVTLGFSGFHRCRYRDTPDHRRIAAETS